MPNAKMVIIPGNKYRLARSLTVGEEQRLKVHEYRELWITFRHAI